MYCSNKCSVAFLIVPWVGLQCVIVVFPDYTHFLISVQTVCKGYQQTILVDKELRMICLFDLILYVPVNSFSVMSGQVFLG